MRQNGKMHDAQNCAGIESETKQSLPSVSPDRLIGPAFLSVDQNGLVPLTLSDAPPSSSFCVQLSLEQGALHLFPPLNLLLGMEERALPNGRQKKIRRRMKQLLRSCVQRAPRHC